MVNRTLVALCAVALLSFTACATGGSRIPTHPGPQLVTGTPVTAVALLETLHVSDPVRTLADSLVEERLRATCPSIKVLAVNETEQRLAARQLVPPRRLSADFARAAREALGVDLLLAPMALGLTYDTRTTVAGVIDAIARPTEYSFDDRAGIALEGWDLRSAERTVRVVRTHSSENSWTASPEKLLRNATVDAVRQLAPLCPPTTHASAQAPDTVGRPEAAPAERDQLLTAPLSRGSSARHIPERPLGLIVAVFPAKVESAELDRIRLDNEAIVQVTSGSIGRIAPSTSTMLLMRDDACRLWIEGKRTLPCTVLKAPARRGEEGVETSVASVAESGKKLTLADGSVYWPMGLGWTDSGLWLLHERVVIIGDTIINLDRGGAGPVRVRRGR
jgi:hypothetical protein